MSVAKYEILNERLRNTQIALIANQTTAEVLTHIKNVVNEGNPQLLTSDYIRGYMAAKKHELMQLHPNYSELNKELEQLEQSLNTVIRSLKGG